MRNFAIFIMAGMEGSQGWIGSDEGQRTTFYEKRKKK